MISECRYFQRCQRLGRPADCTFAHLCMTLCRELKKHMSSSRDRSSAKQLDLVVPTLSEWEIQTSGSIGVPVAYKPSWGRFSSPREEISVSGEFLPRLDWA